MKPNERPSALELLEREFIENRARVLEVAAFLDRLDRSQNSDRAREDFRYRAIIAGLKAVVSGGQNRTMEVLMLLSDHTREPVPDEIPPYKATGAWEGAP